jgi:16S rRNA (guanine527-N7)-methyltransferase
VNREALFNWTAERTKLSLSEVQLDLFEAFEEALYQANEVMNLTRVAKEEAWLRHFLDSLLFVDLIPHLADVLDIGTGPGFPAWPIAVARPDVAVTALDSSGKMLGFLNSQRLSNLETVQARAETWAVREMFDVVTGRAVAPLAIQLELSAPTCRVGGELILMRTPNDDFQIPHLERLGLQPHGLVKRSLPALSGEEEIVRVFPRYLKVEPAEARYPRPWTEIQRAPFFT